MAKSDNGFKVYPKIVPADKETVIHIVPLYDHSRFYDNVEYRAVCYPVDYSTKVYDKSQRPFVQHIKSKDGSFCIRQYFEGEQEHIIYIYAGEEIIHTFNVYSLYEDLYKLRPYKGDIHMHSYRSDGRECPAYVAASCRKVGLDFMAVTDHEKYYPSIEAQEAFEGLDIDLKIFRGEEIHPPNNWVHMVNFGGKFSINEMFTTHKEQYQKEVAEIEKDIESYVSQAFERHFLASCMWCFDRIREAGGLGVFCHPYWRNRTGYDTSTLLTKYMLDKQPFDALEVISGFTYGELESNSLQVEFYHEQQAKGKRLPIVGVTDAHGCDTGELFGWYYTIVFSSDDTLEGLISSIKGLRSVAVEAVPGEHEHVYGPFRLVKYVHFLIREVFPLHDELCYDEGNMMLRYITGDQGAKDLLSRVKGQTDTFYNYIFYEDM